MEDLVLIVGAGPSGLAVAACLAVLSIPFIILEKEDCIASLWKKKTYDCLKLHLAKQFCVLPHMPFSSTTPTFIPKDQFIQYLDEYVEHFIINPIFNMNVESTTYNRDIENWNVTACNTRSGEVKRYTGKFLIVATGENNKSFIPNFFGQDSFTGTIIHSSNYKSGAPYAGQNVLVVGSGNSGMEIAYDLANFGAQTSLCVRSAFHVVTKEMIYLGMILLKYLPLFLVDALVLLLVKFRFGDLSKYGIVRPKKGPFFLKATEGRSPVIDVGTVGKIKAGEIQVLPALTSIKGNEIVFADGKSQYFDAIVFATGYRSSANCWLQDDLLNEQGFPKQKFPHHWKGKNGVYCVGLSRMGLAGISSDAQCIANDIHMILKAKRAM
ncbi:probable indole-3-pyruvate monooxygenase YUCCA10 [Elaeis guineensis]|uniref:Flavin-containing monooxygenase n=1 Tax=Elaeis guineensis var. tenera TaxID=51953 RepID=A0A6I9QP89_ELAGV|nr:probable indole-3-pyruvate monooxygenase YUCCA10 [Elaeis guineensis]